MDSILDEKIYDARIRPSSLNSSDGPTNIQVNLMIRSIDKIDDVKMEFSVQITFRYSVLTFTVCIKETSYFTLFLYICRQKWFDDRLRFSHKVSPAMKGRSIIYPALSIQL